MEEIKLEGKFSGLCIKNDLQWRVVYLLWPNSDLIKCPIIICITSTKNDLSRCFSY